MPCKTTKGRSAAMVRHRALKRQAGYCIFGGCYAHTDGQPFCTKHRLYMNGLKRAWVARKKVAS